LFDRRDVRLTDAFTHDRFAHCFAAAVAATNIERAPPRARNARGMSDAASANDLIDVVDWLDRAEELYETVRILESSRRFASASDAPSRCARLDRLATALIRLSGADAVSSPVAGTSARARENARSRALDVLAEIKVRAGPVDDFVTESSRASVRNEKKNYFFARLFVLPPAACSSSHV
jgi:hypothetical protein